MSLDSRSHSAPQGDPDLELPAYGYAPCARECRWEESVVELPDNKGQIWATLKVTSRAHRTPLFIEGDQIVGSFTLNLKNGDPIHTITASVTGQVLTGINTFDTHVFLDLPHTLWSRSMGNPRDMGSSHGEKFSEKLHGEYSWPFSISLPKEVTVSLCPGGKQHTFHLPRTFAERMTKATIRYELIVHISRGLLHGTSQLQTPFIYIPITRPDPPSPLRQLAYEQGISLLGPDIDPEGWKTDSVGIRGKIFKDRMVEVQCMLALAKPLCYTKGSVIPCLLVLESQDSQALDMLSSPTAIILRLGRRVRYDVHVKHKLQGDRVWKDALEYMSQAVWRRRTEGHDDESHKRFLEGEIPLAKDLQPTSTVVNFSIDYDVELFSFKAVGFDPAETKALLKEDVEIASNFASGPRPTAFSPPAYDSASRPSQQGFRLSPNGGFN